MHYTPTQLRRIFLRRAEDARIRALYCPTLDAAACELAEAERLERIVNDDPFFRELG